MNESNFEFKSLSDVPIAKTSIELARVPSSSELLSDSKKPLSPLEGNVVARHKKEVKFDPEKEMKAKLEELERFEAEKEVNQKKKILQKKLSQDRQLALQKIERAKKLKEKANLMRKRVAEDESSMEDDLESVDKDTSYPTQ